MDPLNVLDIILVKANLDAMKDTSPDLGAITYQKTVSYSHEIQNRFSGGQTAFTQSVQKPTPSIFSSILLQDFRFSAFTILALPHSGDQEMSLETSAWSIL